jgi:hypothetical protein
MRLRISKILGFWLDAECERRKTHTAGKSKQALIGEVLHEFEQAGNAMRYLRADGKIGWKATPQMLDRLSDGERDAEDDGEHDLP